MANTNEIIERNLALTVVRTMFTADDVADMLLDIRQSMNNVDEAVLVNQ